MTTFKRDDSVMLALLPYAITVFCALSWGIFFHKGMEITFFRVSGVLCGSLLMALPLYIFVLMTFTGISAIIDSTKTKSFGLFLSGLFLFVSFGSLFLSFFI